MSVTVQKHPKEKRERWLSHEETSQLWLGEGKKKRRRNNNKKEGGMAGLFLHNQSIVLGRQLRTAKQIRWRGLSMDGQDDRQPRHFILRQCKAGGAARDIFGHKCPAIKKKRDKKNIRRFFDREIKITKKCEAIDGTWPSFLKHDSINWENKSCSQSRVKQFVEEGQRPG